MFGCGDNARGHAEETVAPEVRRQRLAGVDPAAMEVAPSGGEQPDALGEGGVARLDGRRDDGLHPEWSGRHAEPTGAAPGSRSGSWKVKTAGAVGWG